MKISVIIPVYNEEKHIVQCLKSLNNQTLKPLEIIVIDDGSTDNTLKILRTPYSALRTEVVLIKQNHLGTGAARNLGAKKSRGKILVFIDADMEFDQNFLKDLTAPLRVPGTRLHLRCVPGTKRVSGTFSTQELVKNWDQPLAHCWSHHFGFHTRYLVPQDQKTSPVFRAILKSEFDRVNGFDPSQGYADDWSLSEKLGYQAVATKAKYYHSNPDTLKDIFIQARWRAKRQYKLGFLGAVYRLFLHSFPFSLINGLWGAIKYQLPVYFFFKIILDLASSLGILEFYLFKKTSK